MRSGSIEINQSRILAVIYASVAGAALSAAQTPPTSSPVEPNGSIQLPQGPPPTGLARPVPPQKLASAPAEKPLRISLTPQQLDSLVRDKTLTIDDAVGIALTANRDYATAIANLQRARGMLNEAKSALVPQVGIAGQIEDYTQNTTIHFVGESILQVNAFNPVYTGQVTLPLDLFGTIRSAVSQAQFNDVAARIDVNRARNALVFNVRQAFFQALRAQGAYAVAVEDLTNNQTRLSDAQKGLNAGLSSRFDVITVQRDVADAQQNVVNARAQVTLALGQLKSAIGVDVSIPIKVTDTGAVEMPPGIVPVVIPPPSHVPSGPQIPQRGGQAGEAPQNPSPVAPPAPVSGSQTAPTEMPSLPDTHTAENLNNLGPDYLAAVDEALKTRPEILESDAQISAANRGVLYAKRSQLPSVGLQLQYIYQPDATIFVPQHQAVATLSFNVPIFDGGEAAARTQQAKADVANAVTARRTAVDQVTLDVQQAYIAIGEARDRVQVTEAEVAQAKEAYRLSRVRYMAGVSQTPTVSPQLELSNAEVALTVAETNRLNALYDYNVARCQLDRAIGRYSYGSGSGFANPPSAKVTGTAK